MWVQGQVEVKEIALKLKTIEIALLFSNLCVQHTQFDVLTHLFPGTHHTVNIMNKFNILASVKASSCSFPFPSSTFYDPLQSSGSQALASIMVS